MARRGSSLWLWLRLALGLVVAALCVAWTLKDTSWEGLRASLASARWEALAAYVVTLLGVHVTRVLRWQSLLAGIERVPLRRLNEAAAIGFMMLIVLPFRLGELARPYLLARRSSIRESEAMASVVLERVIDGLVVAALLRILVAQAPVGAQHLGEIRAVADLILAGFGGGLVFLLVAARRREAVRGLLRRALEPLAPALARRVIDVIDGFVGGLRQLPGARDLALFALWTALHWALLGWGLVILAAGFDCGGATDGACAPLRLDLYGATLVLCMSVIGTMIPLAPGGAGTTQAAATIALGVVAPAEVVATSGVAWVHVQWLLLVAQQLALGAFYLARSHASLREVADHARAAEGAVQPAQA